jgi:hypothetical protein
MKGRHITSFSSILLALILTTDVQVAVAQDRLYTIRQRGIYRVNVGDYVQVRYQTQATPNGISTLKVEITGDSIQKVAVFNGAIPGKPIIPGGPYYVITVFRVEKQGVSKVTITPVTNEYKNLDTFEFSVSVPYP